MSGQIEIVGILTPKPGNIEQVIEGLQPLLQYVEAHEPGVLKYQLYRQVNAASGEETLVFIEIFKDAETLAKHQKSEVYQQVQKAGAEQELLASPPDIKILRHVGGFGART